MNTATPAATAPQTVAITSLAQLLEQSTEVHSLRIRLKENGPILEIKVRPLTGEELATANTFNDIVPPRLPNAPSGSLDQFDHYDASYRKEAAEGTRKRQAFIIVTGLVDMEVDGATLAYKADYLRKHFPSRVLDVIARKIQEISADDVEIVGLASFLSGDESPAS